MLVTCSGLISTTRKTDPLGLRAYLLITSQRDCVSWRPSTHTNTVLQTRIHLPVLPSSNNMLRVILSYFTPNSPINSVRDKAVYSMDKSSRAAYLASSWLNSESSLSQHDCLLIHSLPILSWQVSLSHTQFHLIILSRQILEYLHWHKIKKIKHLSPINYNVLRSSVDASNQ